MGHSLIEGLKIRYVKRSETYMAALSTMLGKRGRDKPSDCDDSGDGGVIYDCKVMKKVPEGYCTLGILIELERRYGGDDELAPLGKVAEERGRFEGR